MAGAGVQIEGRPRRNKYGAVATVDEDGTRHDSKAEQRRWNELRLLERAGQIRALMHHPKYPLHVNGILVGVYEGDASYIERGKAICEDTKGGVATKTPVYRLKVKLLRALYPDLEHREVMRK